MDFQKGEFTYGRPTFIGDGFARVGKFCSIAGSVEFIMSGHNTSFFTTYPFGISTESKDFIRCNESNVSGKIIIGNDVWIGYGSKILYGTTIGDGCVIAAGSIVRGKFKSYSMIAGNPAQSLYTRFDIKTIEILKKLKWWDLPQSVLQANISSIVTNDYTKLLKFYNEINLLQ